MKLRILTTIFFLLLGGFALHERGTIKDFYLSKVGKLTGSEQESWPKTEPEVQRPVVKKDRSEKGLEKAEEIRNKEELAEKKIPAVPRISEFNPAGVNVGISLPGPLQSPAVSEPAATTLTRSGIIFETNLQRQQNSAGFLSENTVLNNMAARKADDMCTNQYFAHTSPSGVGASDLANQFGYEYISIGENLALGPFASDKDVVQAWMNSPGHRANIVNTSFTEIGVGISRCVYNGRSTWLAVQHFGKPLSDCPMVDADLKKKIEENQSRLSSLRDVLLSLRAGIELTSPLDPNYNQKIDEYNAQVREYNNLLEGTRNLISEYNAQVNSFNKCAG